MFYHHASAKRHQPCQHHRTAHEQPTQIVQPRRLDRPCVQYRLCRRKHIFGQLLQLFFVCRDTPFQIDHLSAKLARFRDLFSQIGILLAKFVVEFAFSLKLLVFLIDQALLRCRFFCPKLFSFFGRLFF